MWFGERHRLPWIYRLGSTSSVREAVQAGEVACSAFASTAAVGAEEAKELRQDFLQAVEAVVVARPGMSCGRRCARLVRRDLVRRKCRSLLLRVRVRVWEEEVECGVNLALEGV